MKSLDSEKEKEIVDSRLNQSVSQFEKSKVSDNPDDWIDVEILLKSHETLMKYIDEAREIREKITVDTSDIELKRPSYFVDKIAKEEKI